MFVVLAAAFAHFVTLSYGHGRLLEPPARNMMWRFGYDTPPNYEDSELFCGGIAIQHQRNNGSCGVCGDRYDFPSPRPHETGGLFSTDTIVRSYRPGQIVDVIIELVANHVGHFEFSLCTRDSKKPPETEQCFDQHILELANGNGTKYVLATNNTGLFFLQVVIPKVRCTNCVFRWHWYSGNNWGICEDGIQRLGCGPQETYRNCADVAVLDGAGIRGPIHYKNDEDNHNKTESYEAVTELD